MERGTRNQEAGSRNQAPGTWNQNIEPERGAQEPGTRSQAPGTGNQNTELATKNHVTDFTHTPWSREGPAEISTVWS